MLAVQKVAGLGKNELVRVKGTLVIQRGTLMLIGAERAADLTRYAKVDRFDPNSGDGYQREITPERVNKAAAYYSNGGRMPNPMLLNVREELFDQIRVDVDADRAGFDRAVKEKGNWIGSGSIECPKNLFVEHLFDGQHRKSALENVLEQAPELAEFPVPVIICLGLSEFEEMVEFHEVNSNAKSVSTDLAWALLRKRVQEDPGLADQLELKGRDWITKGQDVVAVLRGMPGPWKDGIQRPNEARVKADRLIITQAQFVRSLHPVLSMPLLSKADPKVIAEILNAYWKGIAQVMSEPFDRANNPKAWVIQKGPGVIAFHRLLPQVIEVLRARGQRLGDSDAYAAVMKDLPTLNGEIITESGDTVMISGADFWRSGPEGVASQFTGDAGRKRLAVRIQTLLPRPSQELAL